MNKCSARSDDSREQRRSEAPEVNKYRCILCAIFILKRTNFQNNLSKSCCEKNRKKVSVNFRNIERLSKKTTFLDELAVPPSRIFTLIGSLQQLVESVIMRLE
jgi:hypothetical protein